MTVYLIHFDRPLGNVDNHHGSAMHYIGYTDNLERRMEEHAEGRGAAIMRACWIAGIKWRVVRTWEGGRDLERQLKRRKKARCLCPICADLTEVEMTNAKNAEIAVRPGWVTVNEAARAAGYTPAYVRQLAGRGAVEALKVGRDWLVNLESVLNYQQAMAALGPEKHNPWRSGPRGGRKRALVSPGGQAATQEEN